MSKFYGNVDLNKNEIQNVVIQSLSSAPSNPKEGQFYYNNIDKNIYRYDGTNWLTYSSLPYGSCSTGSSTAQKSVTVANFPTSLYSGVTVSVLFQYENTASNPTLKINNLSAIAMYIRRGSNPIRVQTNTWKAGELVTFVYDGTYWVIEGNGAISNSNLVTSVSSSSTDSQVPSAKLFYDTVGDIETVLQTLLEGTS